MTLQHYDDHTFTYSHAHKPSAGALKEMALAAGTNCILTQAVLLIASGTRKCLA